MDKRIKKICEVTSQELFKKLYESGESITTIAAATGISRSQISQAANGHRSLGEVFFRSLLKFAIEKGLI